MKHIDIKPFHIQEHFLSDKECDDLIDLAQFRFRPSKISTFSHQDNNVRNSYTCPLEECENELIINVENKIINLCQ
jgi:hypothetical protein